MAQEVLHIRRSYQIEWDKRWEYWSAVIVQADGESIIASSPPLARPDEPLANRLQMPKSPERQTVTQFEYEIRLWRQGRLLVEKLEAEGWEATEWNAQGQAIRMRRSEDRQQP